MPLAGKQIMPREIADVGSEYWKGLELIKMIATSLSESQGYVGAWNDNLDDDGEILSRDLGLMQINRPGSIVGNPDEFKLRTESTDRKEIFKVATNNAEAAWALYNSPGTNNGKRKWQPWVGYTLGWAMFNSWWTWKHVNGVPTGPWIKSGRYLQRAIPGLANYRVIIKKDNTAEEALKMARGYATREKIEGTLGLNKDGLIIWKTIPKMPTEPPKDGKGPRPIPNKGV